MSATSLDLSQIKTDALSAASTFRTLIGLGTGNTPTFLGASLTGGTVTALAPLIDATQTWNSAGTVFTGMRLNVTDTASSSSSLLMDLQVGGVSQFNVMKDGKGYLGNCFYHGGSLIEGYNIASAARTRNTSGRSAIFGPESAVGLALASNFGVSWSSSTAGSGDCFLNRDLFITRDAAGTLAQRNATNAQTFRIYESFTDASNYTRGSIAATSSGFDLTPEAAGTGSKRPVRILGHSLASAEAVSALEINQTWNTTGTPTLIKANVTDTASNASSLLMDLQRNNFSKFTVQKDGEVRIWNNNDVGRYTSLSHSNSTFSIRANSGSVGGGIIFYSTSAGSQPLTLISTGRGIAIESDNDVFLVRDAANTLAQRNSTAAQTFRIYNTFTDSSNYERLSLSFATYSLSRFAILRAESAGTGSADIGVVLGPKGTGAIVGQMPDGTVSGGNARGQYAVDLQTLRNANTQVASGSYSVIGGGVVNTSSGDYSTVGGGVLNTSSGNTSTVGGGANNTSSGDYSTVGGGANNTSSGNTSTVGGGFGNTSSGNYSTVGGGYGNTSSGTVSTVGGGFGAKATRHGETSHASGIFSAAGDAQHTVLIARRDTTDATANVVLTLDGGTPSSTNRLTLPAETTWSLGIKLAAYNDTDNTGAWWTIRGGVRRNAANGTAMIGSLIVERDSEGTMSGTSASIVADDTNEALEIRVTGLVSKNIRWVAVVDISQVSYGIP
jgi:hypothetical protein